MTDKTGLQHLQSVPITMHVNLEKKAEIGASKLVANKLKGEIVATISNAVSSRYVTNKIRLYLKAGSCIA